MSAFKSFLARITPTRFEEIARVEDISVNRVRLHIDPAGNVTDGWVQVEDRRTVINAEPIRPKLLKSSFSPSYRSIAEVHQLTKVPQATLQRWCLQGKLIAKQERGRWFIFGDVVVRRNGRRWEVEQYLD